MDSPLNRDLATTTLEPTVLSLELANWFAVAFEGLVLTDGDGLCLAINPVALDLLGLEPEINLNPRIYHLPTLMGLAPTQAWHLPPQDTLNPNTPHRSTTQLHRPDGSRTTLSFAVIPQAPGYLWTLPPAQLLHWHTHPTAPGPDQAIANSPAPAIDSPDRYQAIRTAQTELELQYHQELRELLFNESTDALFLVDANTLEILDCNPRAVDLFEADTKQDLLGLVGHEDLHVAPLTPEEVADSIQQMHQTGFWTMEVEYKTRKGNRFWGNIACKPVEIANQALTFVRITDVTHWKRIELDLASSELRFRTIFDQASLGIAICAPPDFRITESNPCLQEILGYTAAELSQLDYQDFTHSEDLPQEEQLIRECLSGRRNSYQLEKRYIRKDGQTRWVNIFGTVVWDAAGEILFAFALVKDISQRKQTEIELVASEVRFRTIFEQAAFGIAYTQPDGYLQLVNPALCRITGYPAAELVLFNFKTLTHPEDLPAELEQIAALVRGEIDSYQMEKRIVRADGSLAWVRVLISPQLDEQGQFAGFIGIIQDITERKTLELELETNRRKYQALFEALPIGLNIADTQGRYVEVNPASEAILGVAAAEQITRTYDSSQWTVWYPDGRPMPPEQFPAAQALLQGKVITNFEMMVSRPDGSTICLSVTAAPLNMGNLGIAIAFFDITQAKKIEQDLAAARLKYQTLFEVMPLGIVITDEQGQILEVNPASKPILAIPAEEQQRRGLDGNEWRCFRGDGSPMPSEEYPAVIALRENRIVKGLEMGYERPDGTMIWLENTAAPIPIPGLGVVLTYADITDRKRTEQALREKDTMLNLALDAGKQGVFEIDLVTGQVIVNSRYWEMLGYGKDEIQMSTTQWVTWLHPEESETVYQHFLEFCRGEVPLFATEFRQRTKTGDWCWFFATGIITAWDQNGTPLRMLGIYSNINDRKHIEQTLRDQEASLRIALEAASQGIWDNDLVHGTTKVDHGYAQMLGYDLEEITPTLEAWENSLHPDDHQRVMEQVRAYLCGAIDQYHVEFRMRTKAGAWKWVLSTGKIMAWDNQGNPIRVLGTHTDIDQRKRAELALQENETRLRLALEASLQGVWDVDLQIQSLTIDLNYAQMLGYDSVDLYPTLEAWAQSLHPQDYQPTLERFNDYISGRRSDYQVEFRLPTKSGAWKWLLSTGKIVAWDNHGQPTRIIGTHIDIDQRKKAELALTRQATQEQLFANITNDIRRSLELSQIVAAAVNNVRHILNADRVLVLRVLPNHHAETIAESVIPGLESLHHRCWLNFEVPEICIQDYLSGDFHFVDHQTPSRCSHCWIPNLTDDTIQSKIIAPINQTNNQGTYIWGILLIQSQQQTPPWQLDDGNLTAKICQQLAIAIQQAELYQSLQAANTELQAANQELEYLARYDGLTEVANRRHFDEHLQYEWQRMEREGQFLGLIICDIDFFKAYNDHYGHMVGDTCLRAVAAALRQCVHRAGDMVARYGGEEFTLILPNTKPSGVEAIALKIQATLQALNLPHEYSTVARHVTLSLGLVSLIPNSSLSVDTLIRLADGALYTAKSQGRNRFCWLTPE